MLNYVPTQQRSLCRNYCIKGTREIDEQIEINVGNLGKTDY